MKIDYVLSYINFSDDNILKLYNKISNGKNIFCNSDYLDLSLIIKLIFKNMPFINKLYITCKDIQTFPDSVQNLIDSDDRVIRVNESEFLPEGFVTFSSGNIEMFLWKIPGLAEHFICGNDDMIPMLPLTEKDFFINGVPAVEIREQSLFNCNLYRLNNCNNTNLIFDRYKNDDDYNFRYTVVHSLKPLTKTICEECFNKYWDPFIKGSLTPIRYFNNYNIQLYILYGLKNRLLINEKLSYKFRLLLINNLDFLQMLKDNPSSNPYHIICFNDNLKSWQVEPVKRLLLDIFNSILEI